ncbi:MAG: ATP-binding cassette subfamily B protein [Cognaticolwellia sp.]|jgi:ABC-type multidrug transport system fused ATPase/permease subunit
MAKRNQQVEGEEKVKFSREGYQKAKQIIVYLKDYKYHFFAGMILLVLSSSLFMAFPVLAGELLNEASGKGTYGLTLDQIGLLIIGILVLQGVFSYTRVWLFAIISEKGMANIRKSFYNKLISLPITFFEENRVGELTSRSASDVQQLQDAISITLAEFVRQIVVLIVGMVILVVMTGKLTLLMLGTLPFVVIAAYFFGRYIRTLSRERQDELAKTNSIIEETLQAIYAVKSYTNEWFESIRYGKSIDKVVDISLRFAKIRGLFFVFIITFLFGVMSFILWQGAKMVQAGDMPVGNLVTFISITAFIGGSIAGLSNLYTQLVRAVGSTERIVEILGEPSELELKDGEKAVLESLTGDVIYQDIHFSYPSRLDVPVLKGVNLEIKGGQTVALVGSSGSGKSTIVQLLMRFYDIDSGNVTVNGKDIQDYNITTFRKNIAVVPQEVILFGGTIGENIEYGKPGATKEEILEAARQGNVMEFIDRFPEGLDTIVGDRGIKLSGGQRQRIAIARAILRNPAILLLDEATSSLDAESERVVQDALNNLMKGRTSIVIAHRLATIREADCIYVLEHGEIVEKGTHEELSNRQNGAYSSLAKLQFEIV